MMNLGYQGKRVLVTGSSRGIGYAIARSFHEQGATVILNSKDAQRLEQAREQLQSLGQTPVHAIVSDLSTSEGVSTLVQAAGEIDVLVNNAGAIPSGSIDKVDDETWRTAWNLKVFGYVGMIREVLPGMQERGRGVIVNIIGIAGRAPRPDYICGSMGNAALIAMTQALGGSAPASGVRIYGVNPSPTQSDRIETLFRAQAKASLGDENRWHELTHKLAFGRLARPSEIADLVVFTASDRCGYLSGAVIDVDGGMVHRDTKASH
ncbi:short-chain dehydrogenase/reductase [Orrella marina]|nr:short-chain dehydrogenase/reductase [Orrella marina]